MRIGFGLPNIGPLGTPGAVKKVARRAEELGYDSLWVIERLLFPVKPKTPYPVTPDGSLPEVYRQVLDPLETLTFAAQNHYPYFFVSPCIVQSIGHSKYLVFIKGVVDIRAIHRDV